MINDLEQLLSSIDKLPDEIWTKHIDVVIRKLEFVPKIKRKTDQTKYILMISFIIKQKKSKKDKFKYNTLHLYRKLQIDAIYELEK